MSVWVPLKTEENVEDRYADLMAGLFLRQFY